MPVDEQRYQNLVMRASTYGRLGMFKERDLDITKAKLINPYKSIPLFHFRLLNEDNWNHILSFLQTKQLLVMSSLNNFSRNMVTIFLQEHDIEFSKNSLYAEERYSNRSIVSKLFLPKPTPMRIILPEVMNHPLLLENAKRLMLCSNYKVADEGGYKTSFQILEHAVKTFKNLKRLTVHRIHPTYGELVILHSPNLVYLRIEEDNPILDYNANLISKLTALEHVVLSKVYFKTNPFQNLSNLKIVEYRRLNSSANYQALTWEEIKQQNPTVTFKELEDNDRLYLDEDSPYYFPINRTKTSKRV